MPTFPKIMAVLERSVAAADVRHQVLANNIANINVPGFQAATVAFEEHLKEALHGPTAPADLEGVTTHELHIPIGGRRPATGEVAIQIRPAGGLMRQDGNNVDLEADMARLAANQLWYQALVRSMSDEFNRLRTVITEGRR